MQRAALIRRTVRRNAARGGGFALGAIAVLVGAGAAIAATPQGKADLIYECATSLEWAERHSDRSYQITSKMVWDNYDAFARANSVSMEEAEASLQSYWDELRQSDGEAFVTEMILFTAGVCEQDYIELLSAPGGSLASAPSFGADDTAGEEPVSVEWLQVYIDRTGDYASVADTIVYRLPNGTDRFSQSPEGELLGRMVEAAGAKGLIKFSDASILAMIGAHYWQYNPAASRLVEGEYQRRLRVRNYSKAQGRSWTERAAADRAEQARLAKAKPVGSIGRHCEKYLDPAGPGTPAMWVTKCR